MRWLAAALLLLALAGCGRDERVAADRARAEAERSALLALGELQVALAAAREAQDVADAYEEHFSVLREPLGQADADLTASLDFDLNRLRDLLADGAPRAVVLKLISQIQTDLLTAADALRA